MDHTYKTAYLILAIVLIIVAVGCGVKGPPVAPGYTDPPIVQNLTYKVSGDKLVLAWKIPKADDAQTAKITSAGVYRLKQAMGKQDCPDCPQIFERVANLAAQSGTMTYTDTITIGSQYYYKIILSDTTDRSGGDSNIVHFIHERNSP